MPSATILRNYQAADRKRNMIPFSMFPQGADLSWISDNKSPDTPIVVAFSTTPIFDGADGDIISFTLTANVTSSTFKWAGSTTPTSGATLSLRLIQDATGGWTFAFPANVRKQPLYVIDPNQTTILHFMYLDSKWELIEAPTINPIP